MVLVLLIAQLAEERATWAIEKHGYEVSEELFRKKIQDLIGMLTIHWTHPKNLRQKYEILKAVLFSSLNFKKEK